MRKSKNARNAFAAIDTALNQIEGATAVPRLGNLGHVQLVYTVHVFSDPRRGKTCTIFARLLSGRIAPNRDPFENQSVIHLMLRLDIPTHLNRIRMCSRLSGNRPSIAITFGYLWIAFQQSLCAQNAIDFAHEIVPILRRHCAECHTSDHRKGGFSFNTRTELMRGSENGPVFEVGSSRSSKLIEAITSETEGERMPPDGPRLSKTEIDLLSRWIDSGAHWDQGFAFKAPAYEPPLRPRKPVLPPARNHRNHPIDRIIDNYLAHSKQPYSNTDSSISDASFARRASLDLTGLLLDTDKLDVYLADDAANRRASLIDRLLADDESYAEHWLTFWNDLLRNDYGGTGFITSGRKQISKWLYDSLINNKPYDQFVRELIAPPNDESRGFIDGIKWRGEVSAGQTIEIQFAQSVSQSLLGINLKCASCHDSFIDRWKLDEAYGLAAIYSTKNLEIHRCDKPIGKTAKAKWLFPELGDIDASAIPEIRLSQLASLMTHPENGRFSRTIVNRLWHRLMGRGIVHPTDSMQTEPWNSDLLDLLASDFTEHGYDLKHTLRFIANSAAYQSQIEMLEADSETREFFYRGPRAKRMTAEQFADTVWQLTDTAPEKMDATFVRGKVSPKIASSMMLNGKWIWSSDGNDKPHQAGEKRTFRKRFELQKGFGPFGAVVACDNRFTLYVNGKRTASGDNWEVPNAVRLTGLVEGANELLVVAENQGSSPNPAGLFFEGKIWADGEFDKGQPPMLSIESDSTWQWTEKIPNDKGKFAKDAIDWQSAVPVTPQSTWAAVVPNLQMELARVAQSNASMIRASLLKSDPMMRALGRPNRDQIVSMRPNDLTTLEAMELANGSILAKTLAKGAENLLRRSWASRDSLTRWLYRYSFSRLPTSDELAIANDLLGDELSARGIEDLLWVTIMQPEFQLIR